MTLEKKVDESWKDAVHKEKGVEPEPPAPEMPADFMGFVSTLAMQSLMAMGELQLPDVPATEPNLQQARYLIDVLQMLGERTKGNLTEQEAAELKTLLYELQIKYVKKSKALS